MPIEPCGQAQSPPWPVPARSRSRRTRASHRSCPSRPTPNARASAAAGQRWLTIGFASTYSRRRVRCRGRQFVAAGRDRLAVQGAKREAAAAPRPLRDQQTHVALGGKLNAENRADARPSLAPAEGCGPATAARTTAAACRDSIAGSSNWNRYGCRARLDRAPVRRRPQRDLDEHHAPAKRIADVKLLARQKELPGVSRPHRVRGGRATRP